MARAEDWEDRLQEKNNEEVHKIEKYRVQMCSESGRNNKGEKIRARG